MIRSASVLLLIVALAACPFRCMGAVEAMISCGKVDAHCTCCRPSTDNSDPASIGAPTGNGGESGCDCCDCLCEGAVIASHAIAPSIDLGVGIVLFQTSPPALVRFQSAYSHDSWNELDPSGRTLRVLRQSFQI